MQTWQPIATAPQDGSDILVAYNFASQWVVHLAFWRGCDAFNDPLPEGHEGLGWWSYVEDSLTQTQLTGSHTPTLWAPCPSFPVG